jgi:biotin operon repressor
MAYAFLLMYGWQEGSCFAGQEKMAEEMGISRAQVQRYLYELREAGYIRIERADRRFNNTYVIPDKVMSKLKTKAKSGQSRGRRITHDASDASLMRHPTHRS